jgi:hypothetical protein
MPAIYQWGLSNRLTVHAIWGRRGLQAGAVVEAVAASVGVVDIREVVCRPLSGLRSHLRPEGRLVRHR